MSAVPQLRARAKEAVSLPAPELREAPPSPPPDNPLQLLRDAIDLLKSSRGAVPDPDQVASLLAEAREALERANVVSRAVAQCEACVQEVHFEEAFEILDGALLLYPADPVLVARRRDVEQQQRAFQAAAAVRAAIDEASWLLDQDRIDLALQFLRGKAAEWPEQPALLSGVEELEARLPAWEQQRDVQAALGRAATLEQLQQGQAALTILEEALQSYPNSGELAAAEAGVRERLAEQERRKKFARRLELIEQKIAANAWREAAALLGEARKEFPDAAGLDLLESEVQAGLKRSECQAVAAEVRRLLADGDLEQAGQALRGGLAAFAADPTLEALREELDGERQYREDLHKAQVLFGRLQLAEAERLLVQLLSPVRPEAQALLEAVRKTRAASEEEDFCERGRQKALDLMQQGQFAQAVDLLRNLLTLFPANLILERDLAAARSRLAQATPAPVPMAEPETAAPAPPPVAPAPAVVARKPAAAAASAPATPGAPSPFQRVALAGAASLVLVSAAGAGWKLSQRIVPVSPPPTVQAAQVPAVIPAPVAIPPETATAPAADTPKLSPVLPRTEATASAPTAGKAKPQPAPSLRPFVPGPAVKSAAAVSNAPLPPPPATGAIVSAVTTSTVPAAAIPVFNAPAKPAPPAAAPAAQPKAPAPVGGRFESPQVLTRTLPEYPSLARSMRLYGTVHLNVVIDERGNLKDVKVVSGQPLLAASAKAAVLKWKFKAGSLDDRPVASNMALQITFSDGGN